MTFPLPELVIFDLDGTLIDSVPDIATSADEMMREIGGEPRGEAGVRQWIGNGIENLVRRVLAGDMDGEIDEAVFSRAYPLFLKLYDQHNGERSTTYPGVLAALDFLERKKIPMACVTNKASRFTDPLLERLGLRSRFGVILSGDSLPKKKPDPMPLLHVAEHFGANPSGSVLIGDSISDVKAGRAAGFSVIAVTYGYNHGQDIREAEPDAAIDSLAELAGLFEA
uniref:Phosphoglycolate phosphatase n=1 Tax=Candidatus Kentrum sp. DK TaxID=2126562 RepID=A0A450TEA8_9GAMM|nr:MAG: phosphoglycolate phosphatase [Candidatus Kentron sp. DK]